MWNQTFKMMKKQDRKLGIFLNISLVILGIVIGIAIGKYAKIPFQQEVNIIDLAGLLVTVFLAVYVPAVLDRHLQAMRDRKGLLESRIEDYQLLLRRINTIVQDGRKLLPSEQLTIRNLLDIAGHRIDTLITLIKYSHLDSSFSGDIDDVKKADDEHRALLQAAGKAVEDYTDDIRKQEEMLYIKLDEMTSLLIFKITEAR